MMITDFTIGDLVMWKGIECKVVAINEDTIQANKTDEGQSLRVIDLPDAFTLVTPPQPTNPNVTLE